MQCDGNGNGTVDDQGDYNSSPCTSYRRAKKNTMDYFSSTIKCIVKLEYALFYWFYAKISEFAIKNYLVQFLLKEKEHKNTFVWKY